MCARDFIRHYVGPSVGWSLGRKSLRFFRCLELKGDQFWVTAPAQLLYCPCPPARDWCCRVYGLVYDQFSSINTIAFPLFPMASWCFNNFQAEMYSYMSLICVKAFSRYTFIIYNFNRKQVCIHDSISHVRWAGALMEVRSLFAWISRLKTRPLL